MHIDVAITRLIEAGSEGMQEQPLRRDWWQKYHAAAELLNYHRKGIINARALVVTWNWMENMLGDDITDEIIVVPPRHVAPREHYNDELAARMRDVIPL